MVNQVYLMKTIASAPLAENVMMPQYDRQQLKTRIVHFGFGAFHRAHQALLTDRVLNAQGGDWGICEISLFSGDRLMSQLREQDHLFTVLEKGANGNQPIVIGSVNECLNARLDSLAAIIEKFCEPQVAIVSLTITEKGYCIDPATGKLDPTHPRIIHDLENPTLPQSAPGILVEALARRRDYSEASKLSVDAPDLKFYLSYSIGSEYLQSVDEVIRSFNVFEKKLAYLPWFRAQVIFSYYHLIRDSTRNCYVIRFYLTFQKVFYCNDIDYSVDLLRLWQDANYGMGILFQTPDEETQHSNGNPFGFDPDGLFNFPEPKNPLDDLGSLPDTVTSVNEQMNKICITTRSFKIFNGKKW